jgi:GMP synthase (glutamine-hydrolysing)
MHQKILIADFGSQYTQLIARRVRELNVYCEIYPFNHFPEPSDDCVGVILSGSPHSVREKNAPGLDLSRIRKKLPVLGVCYGAQFMAQTSGGSVEKSKTREYGRANLSKFDAKSHLFNGVNKNSQVWMSHGDTITQLPQNFKIIASTKDVKVAAYKVENEDTYGLQFHPEVYHSTEGTLMLKNFLYDICGCCGDWNPGSFIEETVQAIKKQIGKDIVIMALSGGVDSTVAATLISKAIGKNLHCIFVDNGLLRQDEYKKVLKSYKNYGLNVKGVDATKEFMKALKGVEDPEKKRKKIGNLFIKIFEKEASKIKNAKWLGQGTIYPDVIESVSVKGPSATIKSHHNVGGLPEDMKLKVVEPLRNLFKDEVRRVGKALGIHDDFISRHPFPGPGLAIRILGEITPEKVQILQQADKIYIDSLKSEGLYHEVWQAGAIFLPVNSVGVMGDERTYENVICLRAVTSTDGMTADWSRLPYDFLASVSNKIINNVKGINRVVFDISSKPPATIEWE